MSEIVQSAGQEQVLREFFLPDVKTTINLFGIHMREVGHEWKYPPHEHPQYEINYLIEGEQLMSVNGRDYLQHSGDLMIFRPGDIHSSQSGNKENFTYFSMHFDIDDRLFLSLLNRVDQVLFPHNSPVADKVRPALAKLIGFAADTEFETMTKRMQMQSTVFELFGELWEAITNEAAQLSRSMYEKMELAHHIVSRLQSYAKQSFVQTTQEDLRPGIDDIAKELGISPSHCNRVFRGVFGISPRAYLSDLILHEAKVMLENGRLTIDHIASLLGYREIAHFSRQFKRWTGLSPSAYRKKCQSQELLS